MEFNARKASLFERKQQREAQKLPLFAEQIREHQHDWETEKANRQRKSDSILNNWRVREAALWRKARAMYFALPHCARLQAKHDWDVVFRGAWTPTNLIYVVEKHNAVGAQREAKMREDRRRMEDRINGRLSCQPRLV